MDRAERTGLGVAVAGHVALFAALSLNLLKPPDLPRIANDPIEVELVEDVALVSSAPSPSREAPPEPAPAPMAAPEPTPAPPIPAPPPPAPVVKSQPKPVEKPVAKPVARAPAKPAPAKQVAKPQARKPVQTAARSQDTRERRRPDRPGLSRDLVSGLSDTPAKPTARPGRAASNATPAQTAGPAVQASLGAEIRRQLKPHWKSPTGADVELLRTTLSVSLNRDGSLAGTPSLVSQSGVNDSNRTQAKLHVDQAIKAVRLAAPFKLPAEFYDAWKEIRPSFDRRLSQ